MVKQLHRLIYCLLITLSIGVVIATVCCVARESYYSTLWELGNCCGVDKEILHAHKYDGHRYNPRVRWARGQRDPDGLGLGF